MNLSDKEQSAGWKVSTSHNWLQSLPLSNKLVCRDCGINTTIGKWDVAPCKEHIVSKHDS